MFRPERKARSIVWTASSSRMPGKARRQGREPSCWLELEPGSELAPLPRSNPRDVGTRSQSSRPGGHPQRSERVRPLADRILNCSSHATCRRADARNPTGFGHIHFGQWLSEDGLPADQVDHSVIGRFLSDHLPRCACRRPVTLRRIVVRTAVNLPLRLSRAPGVPAIRRDRHRARTRPLRRPALVKRGMNPARRRGVRRVAGGAAMRASRASGDRPTARSSEPDTRRRPPAAAGWSGRCGNRSSAPNTGARRPRSC